MDSGRSRTPVSIADSPSATDRNSGTTKNTPGLEQELEEEHRQPAGELARSRASPGRTSGSRPAPITLVPPSARRPGAPRAARPATSQTTARARAATARPAWAGPSPTRWTAARRRRPCRARPRTAACPTRSSVRLRRGGDVADLAGQQQDDGDDHDLAGEDQPPRGVRRDRAADQRPGRDRDGTRRRRPGRRRAAASVGREVGGDQGDDRRHDQGGADALQERPADDAARSGSARARWSSEPAP